MRIASFCVSGNDGARVFAVWRWDAKPGGRGVIRPKEVVDKDGEELTVASWAPWSHGEDATTTRRIGAGPPLIKLTSHH
jgi:hypothetical protein